MNPPRSPPTFPRTAHRPDPDGATHFETGGSGACSVTRHPRVGNESSFLGLSLVHTIVNEPEGEIRVESSEGRGTAFAVELPRASKPGDRSTPVDSTGPARSVRILVVDDEEPIRRVLTRFLEKRGHQVTTAENGKAALALLGGVEPPVDMEPPFDVILSDVRMPELGGEELRRRVEERFPSLASRMILMTGESPGNAEGGVSPEERAGVPTLSKPFSLSQVAGLVEGLGGPPDAGLATRDHDVVTRRPAGD